MNLNAKTKILAALEKAQYDLAQLETAGARVIDSSTVPFGILAGQADTLLQQAASIVQRIEQDSMGTVLGKVQSLCLAVKKFLNQRLSALTTILEILEEEEKLLRQLRGITHSQGNVAHHLRALSVFTNIEVAHLGSEGDFQHLAHELSSFSASLSEQTLEISADTVYRKQTVEETKSALSDSLPRLRREIIQMEEDIANTQRVIESDLAEQADISVRFRQGAEATRGEIAGVIAAVQTHDITRQQIEHVQQSLHLIATKISDAGDTQSEPLALAKAGLTIQISQLKNIRASVADWVSQIERCMAGIRKLSASALIHVGPTVLEQERELSSQLAHVEVLQQKSLEYGSRMQSSLVGLSTMAALISRQLQQSQTIRDRLQMLMFNSLIEANRLGRKGVVVSSIANLIRGVSEQWNAITEKSQFALDQMMDLVKQTNQVMEVFSEASQRTLQEDGDQTRAALENIRAAAGFVANQAAAMQAMTETMQANLAGIGDSEKQLQVCFHHLDNALSRFEDAAHRLETEQGTVGSDLAEVENSFSVFYTTAIEREVMHAALQGNPLPVLPQSTTGNSVELF